MIFSESTKIALSTDSAMLGGKGRDAAQYSQEFLNSGAYSTPTEIGGLITDKRFRGPGTYSNDQETNVCFR